MQEYLNENRVDERYTSGRIEELYNSTGSFTFHLSSDFLCEIFSIFEHKDLRMRFLTLHTPDEQFYSTGNYAKSAMLDPRASIDPHGSYLNLVKLLMNESRVESARYGSITYYFYLSS